MMSVGIAMLLMVVATVSVHLGLPQAVVQVVMKICRCHKCLSFWLTLLGLLMIGTHILYAVLLSLMAAYLSNWVAMLLVLINEISDRLWERISKLRPRK